MITLATEIDQKLAILRNEIIMRLTGSMEALGALSFDPQKNRKESMRLSTKAVAIEKVITEQGERLTNVKTKDDVLTIVAMIRMAGAYDAQMMNRTSVHAYAAVEGTDLAVSHILGYLR